MSQEVRRPCLSVERKGMKGNSKRAGGWRDRGREPEASPSKADHAGLSSHGASTGPAVPGKSTERLSRR